MHNIKTTKSENRESNQAIRRDPSGWKEKVSRMSVDEKGRWGEDAAASYYASRGFQILERNFHCPFGEIDLIVGRGDCLRFVEVKARTRSTYGRPADFVDRRKRNKIRRTAFHFLSRFEGRERWTYYLFDVVEVSLSEGRIHCIPNAFALKEGA